MSYGAAILHDCWQPVDLLPGSHVVIFSQHEDVVLAARIAGFNVRDTMLVVGPGSVRFAFLLRKPFSSANLIDHLLHAEVGGMNIGATRTGQGTTPSNGRWPSNLLFVHGAECKRVGERRISGHKGYPNGPGGSSSQFSQKGTATTRTSPWAGHADADGKETIAAWECLTNCPVRILDNQAGERPSTLTGRADPSQTYENPGDNGGASLFGGGNSKVYADSGGASRFFPQFINEDELQAWIVRLIAPPKAPVFFG